jgi:hypothetical protein
VRFAGGSARRSSIGVERDDAAEGGGTYVCRDDGEKVEKLMGGTEKMAAREVSKMSNGSMEADEDEADEVERTGDEDELAEALGRPGFGIGSCPPT